MAKYERYQKLQKYYLGVPVEPAEYKEGELIGIEDYNSIKECEKDTPPITYGNWVSNTSDFLNDKIGFTINSLGTDDDGLYHSTIEGAGTGLELKPYSLIYSHFIDLSNITNLKQMFRRQADYIGGNFTGWNTSKVTTMYGMFWDCSSLTTLDLSSFNTSKVTEMSYMFKDCSSLTTLDLSSFNTSNVLYLTSMFDNCRSLETLDLSHFDTSKVTYMASMFEGCSSLTTLDLSSFDTSNISNVVGMFSGCTSLTTLNISGWDLTKPYIDDNDYQMFTNCTSLHTIYAYGCKEATIHCLNENLSKAGLTGQVTIITQ